MPIVVDTNVVVSQTISLTGAPAEILRRWREGQLELAVSEAILGEYARALSYERVRARHRKSAAEIAGIVAELREFAILVEPEETPAVIADDPDDDKFLWCADTAGAEFIVTRDEHLLRLRNYRGAQIASPAAFLAVLRSREG
jgi:putative PIN family toxin of toxin-antitoxin system